MLRLCRRNKQKMYYALYAGKVEVMDGGLHTGEYNETYGEIHTLLTNISPSTSRYASSEAGLEPYGVSEQYVHAIVVERSVPIDETCAIFDADYSYQCVRMEESLHHRILYIRRCLDDIYADLRSSLDGGEDNGS